MGAEWFAFGTLWAHSNAGESDIWDNVENKAERYASGIYASRKLKTHVPTVKEKLQKSRVKNTTQFRWNNL